MSYWYQLEASEVFSQLGTDRSQRLIGFNFLSFGYD